MNDIKDTLSTTKKVNLHFSYSPGTVLLVLVIIALPIGGFFVGSAYQKGHDKPVANLSASRTTANGPSGQFGGGFGGQGGGVRRNRIIGTVQAVSSTSITITNRAGTNATYTITSGTTVTNGGQTAAISDVQVGATVFLTLDTTNTQNVASISINPGYGAQPTTPPSTSST